ncbi:MAG: FAD-binding oxidoreductase [Clostridia bacterium]|nr:FAD-binding oxidoreductase [Clostridia bacterium]
MKQEILRQIKESFGPRATDAQFERFLYNRDLAPVPAVLADLLFKTTPDLVVRPVSAQEVAQVLKLASSAGISVTPRAGASTVYFDSVPVKGGIVLDLNMLKGVVDLDAEQMTVTVKAATTWGELERYLGARGFAPKSVPSSAPAASVGGWLCMMGYGIGSLKYGPLASQVKSAEVVLPSGEIRRLTAASDPPLAWLAGSEGTLGIVTQVEVEIRKRTPMKHFLLWAPELEEILWALAQLAGAEIVPYNLHFTDDPCLRAMARQNIAPGGVTSGYLLAVDYEGDETELDQAEKLMWDLMAGRTGVSLLPELVAEKEWQERYKALRLKRGGPSELGGEVFLPLSELPGYLVDIKRLAARYRMLFCSYGHVVSQERITIMTLFFADETKVLDYILSLSLVKKIQDVGYRHGGHPYGVGLWNTPYLRRIFGRSELQEKRAQKRQLDPQGIMNPGKLYTWPALLHPLSFTVAMGLMAEVKKYVKGGARA